MTVSGVSGVAVLLERWRWRKSPALVSSRCLGVPKQAMRWFHLSLYDRGLGTGMPFLFSALLYSHSTVIGSMSAVCGPVDWSPPAAAAVANQRSLRLLQSTFCFLPRLSPDEWKSKGVASVAGGHTKGKERRSYGG